MQGIRDTRDEGAGARGAGDRRVRIPDEQAEIADLFARYADALDTRLQQGLATIHESATKIMQQLVAEVWRAGGPEVTGHLREGVLGALARDDALRAMLTHTDERYQALSLRMERMESAVHQLAEATQEVVRRANRRIAEQQAGQAHAIQLLERAGRSLAPLAPRVEAIALALGRQQKGHRQDLARFAESAARAIGEVHRRLHQGLRSEIEDVRRSIRGEIQRLEAAVLSESAFGNDAAAGLHRAVEGVAERTANVLEALRRDLADRPSEQERVAGGVSERTTGILSDAEHRLDSLEQGFARQCQELMTLSERATRGIGQVCEQLHQGLRKLLSQAETAGRNVGSLEKAVARQRAMLADLSDRAGRGIDEMSRRIHDQFRRLLARSSAANRGTLDVIEESIRREIQEVRSDMEGVAERAGRVLEGLRTDVAGRMDGATRSGRETTLPLVTELATPHAGQQTRGGLETITRSLQILLDSIRRSGETQATAVERALRASAGRQEAVLEEALSALRTSMDELTGVYATGTRGNGDTRTAGAALTRRLRGVEQRLADLSRELVGDPHASG
jgi:hypothetical protein